MLYIKYSDRQIEEIQTKIRELNEEALKAYEILGAVMDDLETIGLSLGIAEVVPEETPKHSMVDRILTFLIELHNKALNR